MFPKCCSTWSGHVTLQLLFSCVCIQLSLWCCYLPPPLVDPHPHLSQPQPEQPPGPLIPDSTYTENERENNIYAILHIRIQDTTKRNLELRNLDRCTVCSLIGNLTDFTMKFSRDITFGPRALTSFSVSMEAKYLDHQSSMLSSTSSSSTSPPLPFFFLPFPVLSSSGCKRGEQNHLSKTICFF